MFNFFRPNTAKELLQQANETYRVPVAPVVAPTPSRDRTAYQIGKTEDGRVTLSIGDYDSTTVTMTNEGVDTLIRMLEAAKDTDVKQEQTV